MLARSIQGVRAALICAAGPRTLVPVRCQSSRAMGKRAARTSSSPDSQAPPAPEAEGAAAAASPTNSGGGAAAKKQRTKKAAAADEGPAPERVVFNASMRPSDPPAGPSATIISWNVAGVRALLKKNPSALSDLVREHRADVLCLQEHKLQPSHVDDVKASLGLGQPTLFGAAKAAGAGGAGGGGNAIAGWWSKWSCSTEKKGYSGVALLSRTKPLRVREGIGGGHDGEGRVLAAEFPAYWLVTVYTPNSGDGLKRLEYRVGEWDAAFAAFIKGLEAEGGKPVVLTGDLNCAHEEIDIHSPKTNLKSAGFTPEERASFAENLLTGCGMVDCFRRQYPGVTGYTYWNYRTNARASNKGWRLDYFLVSQRLHEAVHECYHLPEVMGSDHCPVGLTVNHGGSREQQ